MADVIFIAVVVAFFALVTLFVRVCDRIIGADESSTPTVNDAPLRQLESELAA